MKKFTTEDWGSLANAFGCAILTHGRENNQLATHDGSITVNQLIEHVYGNNAPHLVGKPKIFFFQGINWDQQVKPSDKDVLCHFSPKG